MQNLLESVEVRCSAGLGNTLLLLWLPRLARAAGVLSAAVALGQTSHFIMCHVCHCSPLALCLMIRRFNKSSESSASNRSWCRVPAPLSDHHGDGTSSSITSRPLAPVVRRGHRVEPVRRDHGVIVELMHPSRPQSSLLSGLL